MRHSRLALFLGLGAIMLLALVAGCSHKTSPTSSLPDSSSFSGASSPMDPSHPWGVLIGTVKAIDTTARTMSLTGNPLPITLDTAVKVTRQTMDSIINLTLADVMVGDTVVVRGQWLTMTHTFLAQWINLISFNPPDSGHGFPFPGPATRVSGRVLTNDTTQRTMTITNFNHTINVASFARLFKWGDRGVRPIRLADINVGDSVDVTGKIQADSSMTAWEIAVRSNSEWHFHTPVIFAGAIATINPPSLSFTVDGRPETIRTDSLTFIFKKESSGRGRDNASLSGGDDEWGHIPDSGFTKLTFGDLQVGDTVGVFAARIDSLTLYAMAIQDSVHIHAPRPVAGNGVSNLTTVSEATKP